jgi:hypothetical protein
MKLLRLCRSLVVLDFRRAAFPCCHLSSTSPCSTCGRSTLDRIPGKLRLALRYRKTREFSEYKGRDVVTYTPRRGGPPSVDPWGLLRRLK